MDNRSYTPHRLLPAMKKVEPSKIPEEHPVRHIEAQYSTLLKMCQPQFVPDYAEFMISIGRDLADYCMSLTPIEADPFLDFNVLRIGPKMPGAANVQPGSLYTQDILPELADERLIELSSCVTLKCSRLSEAVSARKGALNIKIYRGVFPVWNNDAKCHGVVLAIAPVYAMSKQAMLGIAVEKR